MITREDLRTLATATPGDAVLSVYARTDPRDPANTAATPAWEIALWNELSAVADRLEAGDDRDARLRFRELRPAVEERVLALEPHERARSIAWFFGEEGDTIGTYPLQLPLRGDAVVRDARPYVSPLVDVVDRGAPTGVVLAGRERVRLVHLEQGEASEPDDPAFELELGDWRPYGGTAGGSPSRGLRTTAHQERYDARVDEQRDRLYARAGDATAGRLERSAGSASHYSRSAGSPPPSAPRCPPPSSTGSSSTPRPTSTATIPRRSPTRSSRGSRTRGVRAWWTSPTARAPTHWPAGRARSAPRRRSGPSTRAA